MAALALDYRDSDLGVLDGCSSMQAETAEGKAIAVITELPEEGADRRMRVA